MPRRRRTPRLITAASIALLVGLTGGPHLAAQPRPASPKPQAPKTVRLYVFDCGVLGTAGTDPRTYKLTKEEVADSRMSVPCFLIVHPKGTLIWDVGVVPDGQITGAPGRGVSSTRTLGSQMAEIGYGPADVNYLAFSHYHFDHTANANDFKGSTWLTPRAERDGMFAEKAPANVNPSFFNELKNSKTVLIDKSEYDVFGDHTVVLKSAPGHTPGHQVLIVKLKQTGPVMLTGDLYHYPEERTLHRVPDNEFSVEQSLASRAMIDEYMKKTKTQLWIEHDFVANSKLKKSPEYYE